MNVVFEQHSNIRDTVLNHRDTLYTKTKRKACILVRIDIAICKYVAVNNAGA